MDLMDILSGVGYVLDTPGSLVRGVLSGRPGERRSGREMLEDWGALDKNRPGLDWGDVAGFGVDLVDPLNVAGWYLGSILGRKLAKGAAPVVKGTGDLAPDGRAIYQQWLRSHPDIDLLLTDPAPVVKGAGDLAPAGRALGVAGDSLATHGGDLTDVLRASDDPFARTLESTGDLHPLDMTPDQFAHWANDGLDPYERMVIWQQDEMEKQLGAEADDLTDFLRRPLDRTPATDANIQKWLTGPGEAAVQSAKEMPPGLPAPTPPREWLPGMPGFYSRLRDAISGLTDKPIKRESVLNMLKKHPEGINPDEYALALKEFVEGGKGMVTKDDLLKAYDQNMPGLTASGHSDEYVSFVQPGNSIRKYRENVFGVSPNQATAEQYRTLKPPNGGYFEDRSHINAWEEAGRKMLDPAGVVGQHFGPNTVMHSRSTIRDTPLGRVLLNEEQQSDFWQHVNKYGRNLKELGEKRQESMEKFIKKWLSDPDNKVHIPPGTSGRYQAESAWSETLDAKRFEAMDMRYARAARMHPDVRKAEADIQDLFADGAIDDLDTVSQMMRNANETTDLINPRAPFGKEWENITLKHALIEAAKDPSISKVAIPMGEDVYAKVAQGAPEETLKGLKKFYNVDEPNRLKTLLKKWKEEPRVEGAPYNIKRESPPNADEFLGAATDLLSKHVGKDVNATTLRQIIIGDMAAAGVNEATAVKFVDAVLNVEAIKKGAMSTEKMLAQSGVQSRGKLGEAMAKYDDAFAEATMQLSNPKPRPAQWTSARMTPQMRSDINKYGFYLMGAGGATPLALALNGGRE